VTRLLGDLIKKKYKLDLPHSILERIKLDLCMLHKRLFLDFSPILSHVARLRGARGDGGG
jgi:hypothetical protein